MADISINPVTRRTQYTNNTGLGPFAFNFNILQNTDIVVYKNSTLLTLTTDYTVTINANGTGSVTLTGSGNGTALVLADLLTIVGGRELSRTTDFVTAGDLLASSLNEQLDSNVIMVQQLDERFDRAMKLNIADEDGDLTLPLKSSRAGKTLAFDSSGNPVVGEDIGNWRGNWVAGTTYTVRDLVKDTSNNNVYRVNTAHTSSGSTPLSSNANSAYYDLVVDAESAATSASNAASSASAAASSASAASTSASNASTSATNASNSASAASTSASNAATSETNASNSATSAATQASNAATSASNASTSASNASTSETNAAASAVSASNSATSATSSASSASTSATNAGTSAGNASTSETNAANSASAAATSASNASTSETNAATSATNSANSATASASSATSAAASAASAAASYDYFDDRYLGTKASDPTLDNDGDALVAGALYFNSTANEMRVYDGANWIPASSAGSVSFLTYNYTATSGQTTFSGSDDNAASLSYSVGNLMVTVNGVVLENGTDYTATSGTSVVLTTGAVLNDEVNIYAFKSFTTADMVPASTGGTFTGNVTFSNAATVNGAFTSVGIDDNATATAITIDSSENVGIGTSSPDVFSRGYSGTTVGISSASGESAFMINSSGTNVAALEIGRAGTRETLIYDTNTTTQIGSVTSKPVLFITGGSERARLDSSGNLGIGGTSGGERLLLEGSATSNAKIKLSQTTAGLSSEIQQGSTGMAIKAIGSNPMLFETNGSERMRIDSSGNITQTGATSTTASYTIKTSATNDYAGDILFNDNSGTRSSIRSDHYNNALIFKHGSNTERMRIDSSGNVILYNNQIKFSNTSYENRSLGIDSGGFFIYNDADARYDIKIDGNGYLYNPSMLGSASANSDVRFNTSDGLIYYQTSSQRYKENIQDLPSVLDKVNALRPVTFDEIATGNSCFGLIAEEVVEQIPELVNLREIEGYDEPQPDSVTYSMLSVHLLKAIQEQQAIIEDLKARIQTLEGN